MLNFANGANAKQLFPPSLPTGGSLLPELLDDHLSCNRELLLGKGYPKGTLRSRVSGNLAGNLLFRLICDQETVRQHQKKGNEHPGLIAVALGQSARCNGCASASVPLSLPWHQGLTDASSSASVFQIPIC